MVQTEHKDQYEQRKVNGVEVVKHLDIAGLSAIEAEEEVQFKLKSGGKFTIKGTEPAIAKALARITNRDEVAVLLRERDGDVEPIVEREIAANVPNLAVQRENYVAWYSKRSGYYQPSSEEIDRMWSVLREGDIIHFDFAHSVTVERDGQFFAVDRKGRITEPSRYAPALQARKHERPEG